MSDTVNIRKRAQAIDKSPEFDVYSKVVINVDEETYYEAGNDTGRTMELGCPWGTQAMAENILESLAGFQYQPMTASGALLDPAAEISDGISANGVYSGIYRRDTKFGRLMRAEVSAPTEESVDHEYPYVEGTERRIRRERANTKAEFEIQAAEIAARVTRTGGDTASFGWTLTEDGFVLASANKNVFTCDENGITVEGVIKARSGYIGSDSYGFVIRNNAIYNGVESYDDIQHTGIYLGTDGIVLGRGKFKVSASGDLYAENGVFKGSVSAGSIRYGGEYGTFSGSGLTGGSVGTGQTNSYINSGVADGYSAISGLGGGWISNPNLGAATGWGNAPRVVVIGQGHRYLCWGYALS